MSARDKWVRRFSVDETSKHKNGFTIYKITSVVNIVAYMVVIILTRKDSNYWVEFYSFLNHSKI